MFDPEHNPKPGLNFYLGAANRVGVKFLWPHRFVWAGYWHTKRRQFGSFFVKMEQATS